MKNFIQFITEKKGINKEFIDKYGQYKIYLVDGEDVRNLSLKNEEFGLSSSHLFFPKLIPKNEIWIEKHVKKTEVNLLISSELYKIKLINVDDVEKWEAYQKAERKKREKHQKLEKNEIDKNIYIKEWMKIDDMVIWLVDAEKVRKKYKSDFMEGGHDFVYNWIPDNEIWIENGLNNHEIPFIVLHELVERNMMKDDKMKYDDAHIISSKIEWSKRPDGCDRKFIENLTNEKVLDLIKKFKK